MRYLALYMAPAATIAEMMKMSEADGKKEMEAWIAWDAANKGAIVDLGSPLGKNKTVASSGVSDTHNEVTGYSIVEADSHDAAAKLFVGHPHLNHRGTRIEVVAFVKLEGM
jgi:hypothetical protein